MVFVALQKFLSNIGIGEFYSMMKDKFIYMALQKTSATKEPVSTLPHTPVSCIFFENTQNCFAYISETKYCSVLYSKRMAGYPLSPHIAFLPA